MNLIEATREKNRIFFFNIKNIFDINIQKEKINLESFLSNKDEYISFINDSLDLNVNNEFNIEDLKKIETILSNNVDKIDDGMILSLCYLIGEIIIQELGGNWEIGKFKKDLAYGLPIILFWGKNPNYSPRLSPIEWIELFKNKELRLNSFSSMILQNK